MALKNRENKIPDYYQTVTGRRIPLSKLTDAEYDFLGLVSKKYESKPKQEWTRFAAWWNAEFNASELSVSSVVYRICQDLETRLGIDQGKVSPPDYRDFIADQIDAQFSSRQEFCRATEIDPGQLSRVLAGRADLSMKVFQKVLEVLHAQHLILLQEDARTQASIDRVIATEVIVAAVAQRRCARKQALNEKLQLT